MIGQDDVSARDGNVLDQNLVHTPRNNEGERQRIILGPGDFVERGGIQGIVHLRHLSEPHSPAAVDPAFHGAKRIANLFENQNHAWFERGTRRSPKSGGARPLAKRAFVVRSGIELEAIVGGADGERLHRFKDGGAFGIKAVELAGVGQRELIVAACEESRANLE